MGRARERPPFFRLLPKNNGEIFAGPRSGAVCSHSFDFEVKFSADSLSEFAATDKGGDRISSARRSLRRTAVQNYILVLKGNT
jgi:hypothetical protein